MTAGEVLILEDGTRWTSRLHDGFEIFGQRAVADRRRVAALASRPQAPSRDPYRRVRNDSTPAPHAVTPTVRTLSRPVRRSVSPLTVVVMMFVQ